VPGTGGK
jgi:hypothetical protein